MYKGSDSSKKGPRNIIGIAFCLAEESNQVDWRVSMIVDMVVNTKPCPCGRSTFLAKREY